jgi:hypothetical protein
VVAKMIRRAIDRPWFGSAARHPNGEAMWIDDFGRVVGGVQGKIGLTSVRVRSVAGEAASSQNGTNLEAEIDPVFQGAQQGGQQEHRKSNLTRILGRAEAHFFGVWVQGNHLLLTGREE